MLARNLRFYLLRLKKASPGELLYRFRHALLLLYVKKRRRFLFQRIPAIRPQDLESITLPQLVMKVDQVLVKQILAGATFYLNDEQGPGEACAKATTNGSGFDIRSIWEPARLQHLMILLLDNEQLQDGQTADFIKNQVLGWIDSNPFPEGPHYKSTMECGLRIPVFSACSQASEKS